MSGIKIVFNHLPQLARKAPDAVGTIVRKAAFDVEAYAKNVVPVDTGKLKNSINTVMTSPTSAIVAPHADYAIHVEYGTKHQRAKPYLRPAAEKARPAFIEAMKRLEEHLR